MKALSESCQLYEVRCQACGFVEPVTAAGMFEFLRKRRRIHAGSDATSEIIAELFLHFVPKSCCPKCRQLRLVAIPQKRAASRKTSPVVGASVAKTPTAKTMPPPKKTLLKKTTLRAAKTTAERCVAEKTPVEATERRTLVKSTTSKRDTGGSKRDTAAKSTTVKSVVVAGESKKTSVRKTTAGSISVAETVTEKAKKRVKITSARRTQKGSAAYDDGGDTAWKDIDPVLCEDCGQPIPPERLAIVPETTVCVQCKQMRERDGIRGRDSWVSSYDPQGGEEDFCPRCGAPMRLRTTTDDRITRYISVCSAGCRPRS